MDSLTIEYDFKGQDGSVVRKKITAVDRDEFQLLLEIIADHPLTHTLVSPLPKKKRTRKEK